MIQFVHNRKYENGLIKSAKGGTTIAMEPIQAWFFDTLQIGDFFEKKVGIARCSLEDNYCKKTGRDLAVSRLKPTRLTVIRQLGNGIVVEDKNGALYYLRKVNSKVFFEGFDDV